MINYQASFKVRENTFSYVIYSNVLFKLTLQIYNWSTTEGQNRYVEI